MGGDAAADLHRQAAKRYEDDVPSGPGTFTGIIRMRDKLAHQMLQDIDMSIVWRTARINGPELGRRALRMLEGR